MDRYEAFVALLNQPDPSDLPHRGHRWTCPGAEARRKTVLLPLLVRWAQRRCLAVDPEPILSRAVLSGGAVPCGRVVGFDHDRRRQRLRGGL